MHKEEIIITKGDESGDIDTLISFLERAKSKGATHYQMDWSHDPVWAFKWFRTYRLKSDEEIKQGKIHKLEAELNAAKANG